MDNKRYCIKIINKILMKMKIKVVTIYNMFKKRKNYLVFNRITFNNLKYVIFYSNVNNFRRNID
jgi:hypothetical protein